MNGQNEQPEKKPVTAKEFHAQIGEITQKALESGLRPGDVISNLEALKLDVYFTLRERLAAAQKSKIIAPRRFFPRIR